MKTYDINTPLNYFRPEVTKELLLGAIHKLKPGSPLETDSICNAFVESCKRWNIDQVYLLAHAILESAWGTSRIANDKNNLFGYKAYDSDPYNSAGTFKTKEDCIWFIAEFISTKYLSPSGKWWTGTATLAGMNKYYATSGAWGMSIAKLSNSIESSMFKYSPTISHQNVPSGEKPAGLIPANRNIIITAKEGVNVRLSPTTKEKNILKILPYNSTIPVDGYLAGEEIDGNNVWWKLKDLNYYIWSGTTNIVPKLTDVSGVGNPDSADLASLSKDQLITKIEDLRKQIQIANDSYGNATGAITKQNKTIEDLTSERDILKGQLSNFETIKEVNVALSGQIEKKDTEILGLKKDLRDSTVKAFEGWDLTEMPAGVKGLAILPIIGFKIWTLLKSSLTEGYVIGWKKGGKVYTAKVEDIK